MNLLSRYTKYRIISGFPVYAVIIFCLLALTSGCVSTGTSSPRMLTGKPKNSVPFFDRDRILELQTIAVPPFWGDRQNLHVAASKIISSKGGLTVTPASEINTVLKYIKKDLSSYRKEDRIEILSGIGKAVQADAVLNGFLITKEQHQEIIIQVISSRDSRVLWWQAIDFSFPEVFSVTEQRNVLNTMLSPLLEEAGKKTQPQSKQDAGSPRPESPKRKETYPPSMDTKPKPGNKPVQNTGPLPLSGDISPM
jgi:hypothetical protein